MKIFYVPSASSRKARQCLLDFQIGFIYCLVVVLIFSASVYMLASSRTRHSLLPQLPNGCLELDSGQLLPRFVSVPLQNPNHTGPQSFATLMRSFPWGEYKEAVEQTNSSRIQAFSEQLIIRILIPFLVAESPIPVNTSCKAPPLIRVEDGSSAYNCEILRNPRRVGALLNFGFDVDALEAHLHELDSVVDYFFLMEGLKPQSKILISKPSIWDLVKYTPRFCRFRHKVVHFIVDDVSYFRIEQENLQSQNLGLRKFLEWNNATGYFESEDLIGIGDADEIPNRNTINILKHCKMHAKNGAENIGIWCPYPYDDTIFASYFPVAPNLHDFTLGKPKYWTVAAAERFISETVLGQSVLRTSSTKRTSGGHLLGGMHFSAYPYLPFQIITQLTTKVNKASDLQGIKRVIDVGTMYLNAAMQNDSDDENADMSAQKRIVQNYILPLGVKGRVLSLDEFRLRYGHQEADSIVQVPWFYKCNPNRYASFGRKRDLRLNGVF